MTGFAGTGRLLLLALRIDRFKLAPWVLIIAFFPVVSYNGYSAVFSGPREALALEASMGANPAFMLLVGPAEHFGTAFGFTAWRVGVFGMFFAALMAVFAVTRHARAAEDSGQAELIDSGAVGPYARLTAAILLAWIASAAVGLAVAGTLAASGATAAEGLALGAQFGGMGVAFSGVAAITSQVGAFSRTANTLATGVLVLSYVLRGVADSLTDGQWLLWTNPMGWGELIRPAGERRVLPLAALVAAGVATAVAGGWISRRRDYGSGLIGQRPGPSRWQAGIWGQTATLNRAPMVTWLATFVFLGFVYGLVTGTMGDFFAKNAFVRQLIATRSATETDLTFTFVSMLLLILAMGGGVFGIQLAVRFAVEEEEGRADWVLSAGISRSGYFAPVVAVAVVAPAIAAVIGGVVLAFTAVATGTAIDAGDVVRQAFATVPALWLTAAVGLAFVGVAPLFRWIAWLLVVYWLILTVFGPLLKAPDWLLDTSPFHVIPSVTASDADWAPVGWIVAITVALILAGFIGYRIRSIRGG
ncbi:exporter of polyketide antibiotics [Sinomonas notoginsengisoli]|uniref:ABC transporter permease n=1 Tax=Sinomonas notoginsengisoli TaxID=1457311 RepID=UPI001F1FAD2B|nr:hypothetical protein [Sinomonas notoginsengisoli]